MGLRPNRISAILRREGEAVGEESVKTTEARAYLPLAAAMALSAAWPLTHIGAVSEKFAFAFGFNLPTSLIIWLVLVFVVDRKRGWRFRIAALAAIYAAAVAADFAIAADHWHSAQSVRSTNAFAAGGAGPARLAPVSPAAPVPAIARGLTDIVRTYGAQLAEDHSAYLSEMNKLNIGKLTNPVHIANYDDIEFVRTQLSAAKTTSQKYHALYNSRIVAARTAIASAALPDKVKSQALAGYDMSETLTHDQTQRMWSDESATLDQVSEQYEFLYLKKSQWTLRGSQIAFTDAHDLAEFNSHLIRIRQIAMDEATLQQAIVATGRARLASIKRPGR